MTLNQVSTIWFHFRQFEGLNRVVTLNIKDSFMRMLSIQFLYTLDVLNTHSQLCEPILYLADVWSFYKVIM